MKSYLVNIVSTLSFIVAALASFFIGLIFYDSSKGLDFNKYSKTLAAAYQKLSFYLPLAVRTLGPMKTKQCSSITAYRMLRHALPLAAET